MSFDILRAKKNFVKNRFFWFRNNIIDAVQFNLFSIGETSAKAWIISPREKKTSTIQYVNRKCGTRAREFSHTIAREKSKNEKKQPKKVRREA